MFELDFYQVVGIIVGICAAITSIGGAAAMIMRALGPAKRSLETLDRLERLSKRDYEARLGQEDFNKMLARSHMAVLAHLETNNHTDTMREARLELQNFLILNYKPQNPQNERTES
jgi:hypothetical protein